MHTSTATVALSLNNYNRENGEFEALNAQILFAEREAAEAFVASLPKTAQRRVFVSQSSSGGFTVTSDGRTYEKSALLNFRRFVKAALAADFAIAYRTVAAEHRADWNTYAEESDIKAAFGIA